MLRMLTIPLRRCVTAVNIGNGKIAIPKTDEGILFFTKAILAEKDKILAEKALAEKDTVIAMMDKALAEKELNNFKYDFAIVTERYAVQKFFRAAQTLLVQLAQRGEFSVKDLASFSSSAMDRLFRDNEEARKLVWNYLKIPDDVLYPGGFPDELLDGLLSEGLLPMPRIRDIFIRYDHDSDVKEFLKIVGKKCARGVEVVTPIEWK